MSEEIELASVAAATALAGAFPNPFNPSTSIRFRLGAPGRARLELFDAAGKRLAILLDERLAAGPHELQWGGVGADGQPLPSGVYALRLLANGFRDTQKLTILK